jgi:hypothetical protein
METRSSFHDDEELHTTPQSSSTRGAARILDMLLAQFHTEVGIGVGVETRKSRLLLACGFTLPSFVSVDLRLLRFTRRLLSVLDYVDTPCPILRASSSTPTYGLNHQERGNRQCPCGSLLIRVLQIAVRCCDEAETWLLRDIEVDFLVLSEVKCVFRGFRHCDTLTPKEHCRCCCSLSITIRITMFSHKTQQRLDEICTLENAQMDGLPRRRTEDGDDCRGSPRRWNQ